MHQHRLGGRTDHHIHMQPGLAHDLIRHLFDARLGMRIHFINAAHPHADGGNEILRRLTRHQCHLIARFSRRIRYHIRTTIFQ